jgi:Uma2 family endonuclease
VCAANPEAVLELDADGSLIEMTLTGGSTSARNSALLFQLQAWDRTTGDWIVFDSSAGFRLPDGSVRSSDASLLRLGRWRALSDAERDGFPPLCPDLVVELAGDLGQVLRPGSAPPSAPLPGRRRQGLGPGSSSLPD